MSTTPSHPPRNGLQDFNAASSVASTSSAYQLYYVRFYSSTYPLGPSSYAIGYRPRWGAGPIEASTTIYIGCARGTVGSTVGKAYRQTNIAAEKAAKKAERVDVYWLGKINDVDSLVRVMGNVIWETRIGIEKAQKLWCVCAAIWINAAAFRIVAAKVTLPKDEERNQRVWTLGS